MKIETLAPSYLIYTGIKPFSINKINNEIENYQMKKFFEEEKQKVQLIYNSQGKVVKRDGKGRNLNILV
jgi:hypothetical protein